MDLFVGLDIGTSGVRAVAIDESTETRFTAAVRFSALPGHRADPGTWVLAVRMVLSELLGPIAAEQIRAIAVDGTSGTVLVTDAKGSPVSKALMYGDRCDDEGILTRIARHAPAASGAHGVTSGLAKALLLFNRVSGEFVQHEADWIAGQLSGLPGFSDENNALKTGYDPIHRSWPDWIAETGMPASRLPQVLPAGAPIGPAHGLLASDCGLHRDTLIVAGTTDGCASFLATGANQIGDGVTVLGSTLTIKLLCASPIYEPESGVYSHRVGDQWLAGGASNTGGKVLDKYFTADQIQQISAQINHHQSSGLDYYPLTEPGERFPVADSAMAPRLEPRPDNDTQFLHGILEGISAIEMRGYQRLAELGKVPLRSVRTTGGGAVNPAWTAIRQRILDLPFPACLSDQAATGSALLALRGARTHTHTG